MRNPETSRRRPLTPSIISPVLLFGLLPLAGCGTPYQIRDTVSVRATLESASGARLILENNVGDVVLNAVADAKDVRAEIVRIGKGSTPAEAQAAIEEIEVTLGPKDGQADTIVAKARHPRSHPTRNYEVRWKVTAPSGVAVTVSNGVGDLDLKGFTDELSARTGVGHVHAVAGGPVDLRSKVGDVRLRMIAPPTQPVVIKSDVGTLELKLPAPCRGRLSADTGVGSVSVDLGQTTLRNYRQRRQHVTAEMGDSSEPSIELTGGVGDVVVRTCDNPSR